MKIVWNYHHIKLKQLTNQEKGSQWETDVTGLGRGEWRTEQMFSIPIFPRKSKQTNPSLSLSLSPWVLRVWTILVSLFNLLFTRVTFLAHQFSFAISFSYFSPSSSPSSLLCSVLLLSFHFNISYYYLKLSQPKSSSTSVCHLLYLSTP